MTIRMRDDILANQITYYNGLIAKHKQNVEIYLNNPVGIGEHPDVMAAIEAEVTSIAPVSYTHLTLPTMFEV